MRSSSRADLEPDRYAPRAIGTGRELDRAELLDAPLRWPRPSLLTAPATALRGIGPGTAEIMRTELEIENVEDLLLHLPREYEGEAPLVTMDAIEPGKEVTVLGVIGTVGRFRATGPRRGRGRRPGRLEATLADIRGRGAVRAVWFNQPWLAESLRPGMRLRLLGAAERGVFVVSGHEVVGEEGGSSESRLTDLTWRGDAQAGAEIHNREPVPVHPATERLPSRQLRRFCWQGLSRSEHRAEALPARLRAMRGLPTAAAALRAVHFPALVAAGDAGRRAAEAARQRLAFEELLLHQTVLARRRQSRRLIAGRSFPPAGTSIERWRARLPFALTGDQERAIDEIGSDLESGHPMQRLLMGEVGSGKTVVALWAMLRAVEAGGQAALMAPTEVLAEQHAATLGTLLEGTGIECGLLTGSTPAAARRELLSRTAAGDLQILVGTHALIEETVSFSNLALAVVDEQHRFGVRQRALLDQKTRSGHPPHTLHMSATPIPRTLALLGYGDLDLSVLRELPSGRQPIETRLIEPGQRQHQMEELRERLRAGHQAYVICPLVDESETLMAKAALAEADRLAGGELKGFRIDVLHGRLSGAQKRAAMTAFSQGETDVLVATTVIEVGVDVPNATTIVIEGAERFGIAQLHQLRGRVGRGRERSYCLLMPEKISGRARRRLSAVASTADGFRLAELDLRLRGAGEILGSRQHGLPEMRTARMPQDEELLVEAGMEARRLLGADAGTPGVELLIELAETRFGGASAQVIAA